MRTLGIVKCAPVAFLGMVACARGPAEVIVDPSVTHQTMHGWEATAQIGFGILPSPEMRDSVLQLAVEVIGINRLRLEVRSGAENPPDLYDRYQAGELDEAAWRCLRYMTVNDNDDPGEIDWGGFDFRSADATMREVVLPMQDVLRANDEELYLTLTYVAFVNQSCGEGEYIHASSPEEYGEFVLAVFLHLQEEFGLVPNALEIVLEPDLTGEWSAAQLARALTAAAGRLGDAGFRPDFIAPSASNVEAALAYFEALAEDPDARGRLTEFSYHRYGETSTDDVRRVAASAAGLGIRSAMLERIGAGVAELHEDLTLGDVSAWQQFALAFPTDDDGAQLITYTVSGDSAINLRLSSRARVLAQYSHYVRPGDIRIGAASSAEDTRPVAFRRSDGGIVTVIGVTRGRRVRVSGLPPGRYGVTRTNASQFMAVGGTQQASDVNGITLDMVSDEIVTLFPEDDLRGGR